MDKKRRRHGSRGSFGVLIYVHFIGWIRRGDADFVRHKFWLDFWAKWKWKNYSFTVYCWVRNCIRSNVGDVELAAVPCGFGNAIGNKFQQGGVGLRMRICGQIICFVNYHFAAHLDVVNRLNHCTLSS
ncbi:unnamed protein product [Lactuca saligna]|uniref:Inositol polyphosphate-related phosphatase domain-containing protein n=1 Tax=Lactuca saligna TaxID=75948 RepID=A0AA36A2H0_LACSI|nr:unnamed protein product [Lactuca saligna]